MRTQLTPGRTTPVRRRAGGLALVAVAALALAGCSGGDSPQDRTAEPVRPSAVELAATGVPEDLRIGVLVTLNGAPGQGSEWLGDASGAQVAAYRMQLGGRPITLDVVDDKGTAEGAAAAVDTLVQRGAAGIVAATSGTHLVDALPRAAAADTAVLAPYESSSTTLPDGAWATGPAGPQVEAALDRALAEDDLDAPFVITAGSQRLPGLDAGERLAIQPGADPRPVAAAVQEALSRKRVDSVVVAAPAATQAALVKALQGGGTAGLPVLLGSDAVSPVFASTLAQGGSLDGDLTSIGLDAADATAVTAGDPGSRAGSFFSALRMAAGDPDVTDLFGQGPFSTQAGAAGIRSHDAVVALVRAAAEARSTEAAEVLAALGGLRLTGEDGLAGPDLDLTRQAAVADTDVQVLHSTPQDPSVRPASTSGGDRLFWFAVPTRAS